MNSFDIGYEDLQSYLRATGWRQALSGPFAEIWQAVDNDQVKAFVPRDSRAPEVQRVGGELYEDTTKSGRARPVPLPLICLAALRWHRMRQREAARLKGGELSPASYVFTTRTGRPIDPQNVNRSFFRITAAGLRRIRLHDARHGCATLLTAAGVAPRVVMEILGHSQISITMDVHTHVTSDTQREAISHMDRLPGGVSTVSDRPG